METLIKVIGIAIVFAGIVMICSLILAFPTMLLWNWLMPTIFGVATITFWQAIGVNFLCAILFKSGSGVQTSRS